MSSDPIAEFFVSNEKDWEADWATALRFLPPAGVKTVENGICLPLRYDGTAGLFRHVFLGGCCDSNGVFVAGHSRHADGRPENLTCTAAYPVDGEEIPFRDEEVVFGGMMIGHWGHLLTDSTARLWYPVLHPEAKTKIVFLDCLLREFAAKRDWRPLMELAGIDPARIEILERPTRFRRIVVPDQAVYSLDAVRPEWILFFDAVRANAEPSAFRKVYFSRTRFSKGDTFNEDLFESYWRELGFHVVHPEECSVKEEISLLAGADELVATIGTLSHNFLFAKDGARATVLLRTGKILRLQLLIGAARRLRTAYVEACRNVLPTHHFNGVYFLSPTSRFHRFLETNRLPSFGESRALAPLDPARIRRYVEKWFETFSPRPDPFAHSPSDEKRARGKLATVAAVLADGADRCRLIDAIASFVDSELKRAAAIETLRSTLAKTRDKLERAQSGLAEARKRSAETKRKLGDADRALNRMWRRTLRGRIHALLLRLRIVRPAPASERP